MKKEAMLYDRKEDLTVLCRLCSHHCVISDSKYGFCGVRKNEKGVLYTCVYGEVIASHVDPIEKKPLYHFLPGSSSYSIAAIGCNFHCGFCQNWQISQISARDGGNGGYELKPEEVVREAIKHKCKSISYTYTEPTIFFEYAYDTAKIAKQKGLYNNFVTNGFMTKDALSEIKPYLDAANVDLKSFSDEFYKTNCKSRLKPVLESIEYMHKINIWVEITTLVIPGENDSLEEFKDIANFIASIGKEIPWHISRFHPDFKFTNYSATPVNTLKKAFAAAKSAGLKYVYLGNVLEGSDTFCYHCGKLLIKRGGLYTEQIDMNKGACPSCNSKIEGIWE